MAIISRSFVLGLSIRNLYFVKIKLALLNQFEGEIGTELKGIFET